MRFRRKGLGVLVFAFATVMAVGSASAATCTNASFKGVFGYYHGRPVNTGSNGSALVGQITADGEGKLSGVWTQSDGGTITSGIFTGSYEISKNCTGTLALSSEGGAPANFNVVLDDANKGFQMIQTETGDNQPGFGLILGTATCGLPGKKQIMAINVAGAVNGQGGEPESIVGQVTLDGKGNITGSETIVINGTASTVAVTGSYTQTSTCTGTAQMIPAGFATMNFATVAVNGNKELLLIETDSNTYVVGNAQQ